MKIIVIGCGRTGAGLARALDLAGHDVTVVDALPAPLDAQLGPAVAAVARALPRDRGSWSSRQRGSASTINAVQGLGHPNTRVRRATRAPRAQVRVRGNHEAGSIRSGGCRG